MKIKPGTSHTYEFQCWQSGTFFYHSSMGFQVSQGLIGAFIVLPSEESLSYNMVPDRDFVLMLQQWEIPQQSQLGKVDAGIFELNMFDRNPNFFTINGKAFPDTSPLLVRYGEHIKLRSINKASQAHSLHTHGHDFTVTRIDGFPRCSLDDTINVASGRRIEVDFMTNNPGVWPLNGTKTFHQSNNGVSPGGMISRIIYAE